ncbi:hypothetical protein CNMCM5623_003838 [Aspergillus felis]|uniref:beta-glucosidase n=1 Tax=Aspergillus felis TaxID=1287682 RepID=A0A8H6QD66_9EURO|nr:hypothetical protein CNMCM5623_003838 [Aspergillus felis]
MVSIDVDKVLAELTIHEKIQLLSGKDTWRTTGIDRLNTPPITTTDGPLGARGVSFFNGPPGMLLPCATAMGATFDRDLIASAGKMLGRETREKGCQILLAPTVCLQRSPLIGRGFEAFGEGPWLSGTLAAAYINGVQSEGVGCAIKHYAAHNQSSDPHDDSIWASERTLREVHLLPFQIATRHSNPWTYMTSYHRINGVHTSEDPWLINQILRDDWKWDGLVMSDWFGMCSTAGSLNAGLDLEMPGPTRWRGPLPLWSFLAGKVKLRTIDFAVRNLLNLINRVQPSLEPLNPLDVAVGDTPEKRELCRRIAAESIVLLKNEKNILPLDAKSGSKTYGLIGPGALYPAVSGGGSADLVGYYVSQPLDALKELVGVENVTANVGCYGHLFSPLLEACVTVPGTSQPGYYLEYFMQEPDSSGSIKPLVTTTTTQAQMYFADNLPEGISEGYWVRVSTTYTAEETGMIQLGFMEGTTILDAKKGQKYQIVVLLQNEQLTPGVGALNAGGLRIGCSILAANPNTIIVTQAGCPIALPWVDSAKTLVHAWYGGQETGNAIMDVLFGKVNPSGRISVTFPKRLEDTPAFLSFGKLQNPPLFYFGYGLSYTTFTYCDLKVPKNVDLANQNTFEVSVKVQNTGTRDGSEVIQVYVSDLKSSVQRPARELKGYSKVHIPVGGTVEVPITLDKYALSFYSQEHAQWLAEKGTFEIIIATSADAKDEILRQPFELVADYLWSGL